MPLVMIGTQAAASVPDPVADLNLAFVAAFGGAVPMTRAVQPAGGNSSATHVEDTFSLTPDRLVPLGGSWWALIANETLHTKDGDFAGHAAAGAVAVAYLDHTDGWSVEHVWYEVAHFGVGGVPGNSGAEIHQFAGAPLYLASNTWCGMGECSDTVAVIALEASGPRSLGTLEGGAVYPSDPGVDTLWGTCDYYDYKVRIVPPVTPSHEFGVVYEGWTAAADKSSPRHRFRRTADAVLVGAAFITQPKLRVPDCAR